MGIRKPYMKLCQHGNTEITYIVKNGAFEVTFEQAVNGGFKTVVFDEHANLISNQGFDEADIKYFQEFLSRNIKVIREVELDNS